MGEVIRLYGVSGVTMKRQYVRSSRRSMDVLMSGATGLDRVGFDPRAGGEGAHGQAADADAAFGGRHSLGS